MWTDERAKGPVLRHPEGATRQGWGPVDPFDPTDLHFWIRLEHLARYQFAADLLGQFGPNGSPTSPAAPATASSSSKAAATAWSGSTTIQ